MQVNKKVDWKKANIVPIFKNGNMTDANNYRPVSLTVTSLKFCAM